jgi:hypothetical protein
VKEKAIMHGVGGEQRREMRPWSLSADVKEKAIMHGVGEQRREMEVEVGELRELEVHGGEDHDPEREGDAVLASAHLQCKVLPFDCKGCMGGGSCKPYV